jgi:putative intracellular protease/amidase
MSDEAEATVEGQDENLDEHGLVIHEYVSTVLVIVPSRDFAETTLRYARSALYNVHVGTYSVSTDDESLLQGTMQDEFQVDAKLDADTSMDDFSGLILCGGPGALELADHPDALRLARQAAAQDKLVAAWGESTVVLARAGVVRKRRVTGAPAVREEVERAGGRFTGRQVETDGRIVTAIDDAAGFRFGRALVAIVGI